MNIDKEKIHQVANIILTNKKISVLTGAGISVESGIPDFRSENGIWTKFDINEYGTLEAFINTPEKSWRLFKEIGKLVINANPNEAHKILAKWESSGFVDTIITQNIDNLHQKAGSKNVLELHGGSKYLRCLECSYNETYSEDIIKLDIIPKCPQCGAILKPDIVLFGEPLPEKTLYSSFESAVNCKIMMVIGTSATVVPAALIPSLSKKCNAVLVEINLESTSLTSMVDFSFNGNASSILGLIDKELESLQNKN